MWRPRPPAPARPPELVRLETVGKGYAQRRLFDGLDLTISSGERIVLDGPSGSGKSTLGDVMLGLKQPDAGRVVRAAALGALGGQKLYQDPAAAFPPRARLGQVLQDLIRLHRLDAQVAARLMERLGLDRQLLERRPDEVSGGELQRLSLVRVLMMRPLLVVADEPTSRLDPITQKASIELMLEIVEEGGAALVLITHDPWIARAVGGQVVTLGG
jgi:peptide/nickel transport system ATP-binding protein